jgi:poly-beta-1,6-N-acetyl-D-glucosamine synthase
MIAIACLIVLLLGYAAFMAWLRIGIVRLAHTATPSSATPVRISVVIAARNEAQTISNCLRSLGAQTWHPAELIVVNDASTDSTRDVILSHTSMLPFPLRIIDAVNSLGKKQALAQGIRAASGDIIACTDADCTIPPRWIETLSNAFQDAQLGFLSMPVGYKPEPTLFNAAERLDFFSLMATGACLIALGHPTICNGANLAYRKAFFFNADDLEKGTLISGDDETIMRGVLKRGASVKFLCSTDAQVTTAATNSFSAFVNQRKRWASKSAGYARDKLVFSGLVSVYLLNTMLLLSPLWAWVLEVDVRWIAGTALTKLLIDLWILNAMETSFNQHGILRGFFGAELLQLITIPLAPLLAKLTGFHWKGNLFR